jgi:hypothetical protein
MKVLLARGQEIRMGAYRTDDETPETLLTEGDLPVKTCPECSAAFGPDIKFCPDDGAALISQPIRNTCPDCRKDYPLDVQICPADGAQLLNVMPVGEGFDRTWTIDGQDYGVRKLEGVEEDHLNRSMCASCGAWKNWTGDGMNYVCNSCGAHYLYTSDGSFKVLGKINDQGNLVFVPNESSVVKSQKTLEESPFYNLLSEIDESNRKYWIAKFKGFKEEQFNRSWNWPSFFFGPMRYFLKGMSGRGALYLFVFVVVTVMSVTVAGEQGATSTLVNSLTGLALSAFFAAMGSNDYYRFCLKYRDNIPGAKRAKFIGKINAFLLAVVWITIRVMADLGTI